jgi:hypothetical protein
MFHGCPEYSEKGGRLCPRMSFVLLQKARQRAAGRKNVLHERILRRGARGCLNRFKERVDRASEHLLRCSYTGKKKRKMLLVR